MVFEPCVPYHWQIRSKHHLLFLLYPFWAKLGIPKQFTNFQLFNSTIKNNQYIKWKQSWDLSILQLIHSLFLTIVKINYVSYLTIIYNVTKVIEIWYVYFIFFCFADAVKNFHLEIFRLFFQFTFKIQAFSSKLLLSRFRHFLTSYFQDQAFSSKILPKSGIFFQDTSKIRHFLPSYFQDQAFSSKLLPRSDIFLQDLARPDIFLQDLARPDIIFQDLPRYLQE